MGKESVDDLLAFRAGHGLFGPIWNRERMAYVQTGVPEMLSIDGQADFYDGTGAYRHMIVTDLFQVLGLIAMEPPASPPDSSRRDEQRKVFVALQPIDSAYVVRGRYDAHLEGPGVSPTLKTETFVALRGDLDTNGLWPSGADELVIDFSDPGNIDVAILIKESGPTMRFGQVAGPCSSAHCCAQSPSMSGSTQTRSGTSEPPRTSMSPSNRQHGNSPRPSSRTAPTSSTTSLKSSG
ncbi:MAG: hypothetical protein ACP5H2_03875 [Solirubrobacteraceae bacterium]